MPNRWDPEPGSPAATLAKAPGTVGTAASGESSEAHASHVPNRFLNVAWQHLTVLRLGVLVVALALAASGCGHHSASSESPVTAAEWHGVLRDRLQHGRFAKSHSCAATVVARSRIAPVYREGTPLVHALDVYERSICPTGNVWAVHEGMPDRQVASLAGAPIPWLSRPHCWAYHTTQAGTSVDGRSFCFTAGRVTLTRTAYHL